MQTDEISNQNADRTKLAMETMKRYCDPHPESPSALRRPQLLLRGGVWSLADTSTPKGARRMNALNRKQKNLNPSRRLRRWFRSPRRRHDPWLVFNMPPLPSKTSRCTALTGLLAMTTYGVSSPFGCGRVTRNGTAAWAAAQYVNSGRETTAPCRAKTLNFSEM
jgi:hypothetical protein